MDNNLNPKNEYFSRKQEKEETIQLENRKRVTKKAIRWIVVLIVLGLLMWPIYSYFKQASERENKPSPGQYFQAQSRDHIRSGAEHPEYNSNPPTGGWHYDVPAQSGIYDTELSDEQLVHNLEHGHIWFAYRSDLPVDQIERLADIAKGYGSRIIMTKRVANNTRIAIVAWERLLKMEDVDEEQIRNFVEAYRGIAGPEKIPDFGFKDFRGSASLPESGPVMNQTK